MLPPNDALSAQAQRARQNVQLIQARNAAALAEARAATSIPIARDGKTVKLPFTTMTVPASGETPPNCPDGTDFKVCDPP